ncbi:MAG: DNA replication/repair protein RecF [Pseudomonadota bacterium]
MALKTANISHFRCLGDVHVEAHPAFNLIVGPNGSGKTSFLESLYFLGRGRSFRSTRTRGLVQDGHRRFVVRAELEGAPRFLGVEGGGDALRIRVDGHAAPKIDSLVRTLPIQVIEPGIHRLVDAGPAQRRSFLDWGVFHVKHTFLEEWRRYQRALRQRNAVLRQGGDRAAAAVWEDALIASGSAIDQLRATYLEELAPHVTRITEGLLDDPVEVVYHRGWSSEESLADALAGSWDRDQKIGITHVGPQRADLRLRFADRVARDRVSRGQQKLLAAALVLAQVAQVEKDGDRSPILLLDDPAAELDRRSLGRLLAVTSELPVQQFVTALETAALTDPPDGNVFHVEQGEVRLVV